MVKEYESEVEAVVCSHMLLIHGVFSVKMRDIERGYPDRMFLIPTGLPLFVEFKREGEDPRPYQLMIHARLRHAGYEVQVHDNAEEAIKSIRKKMDTRQGARKRG